MLPSTILEKLMPINYLDIEIISNLITPLGTVSPLVLPNRPFPMGELTEILPSLKLLHFQQLLHSSSILFIKFLILTFDSTSIFEESN